MNEIKIEKGIPITKRQTGLSDVVRKLNISDSFEIEATKMSAVYSTARSVGVKVAVRKKDDKIRVWRIA